MNLDPIDIIIGADLFGMLILNDVRHSSQNEPTAQNTTLGWILSGPTANLSAHELNSEFAHHGIVLETLGCDLRRFWEIEEVP